MFEALFKYPADAFGQGRLVLLSPLRGEWLLLALAALVGLSWLLYRQVTDRVSRRARYWLLGLRVLMAAAMVFLLATPALRTQAGPRKRLFTAVLIDTSRSMSIDDQPVGGERSTRLAAAVRLLAGGGGDDGLLAAIAKHSKVLVYTFDEGASRRSGGAAGGGKSPLAGLKPLGVYTDVFRSVREVDSELRGLPLVAAVMVTDGCRNRGGSGEDAARLLHNRGARLFTVGLGEVNPPKDFEIIEVFAPKKIWRNTEVNCSVTVRHTDFHEPFDVQVSRGSHVLMTRTIDPRDDPADVRRVDLTFTPDHLDGPATYRVSVPAAKGEKVRENNAREFVLEVLDDRLPVLYVEGSLRMEYRFLRRALFRDRDFRLVGLVRLASDRFYIQGANPAELYLKKGFPTTRERLFAFKAVVLGDIEADYFTPQQLAMLEAFVKERGGGLLMLGGVNSFHLGGYAGTPVARMLPVALSPSSGAYSDQTYTVQPVGEAVDHMILRMEGDAEANRRTWENAPPLIGITPVGPLKRGAEALLVQKPSDGGRLVLAVQNYGAGRVAAFTSGGSWYWQVSRPAADAFHEKFWKQMIRWLIVGAKERLTVSTDADVYARRDWAILRATVRGKDLRAINDATVTATVTDPMGNTEDVPMYWTLAEEGVYQCRYKPSEEGHYRVSVRASDPGVKPAEAGFEVCEPFIERSNAGLKENVLRTMAEITGGKYVRCEDAAAFDREASAVAEAIAEAAETARLRRGDLVDRQLWDMPVVFVFCVALMALEWIIRRKSGLA